MDLLAAAAVEALELQANPSAANPPVANPPAANSPEANPPVAAGSSSTDPRTFYGTDPAKTRMIREAVEEWDRVSFAGGGPTKEAFAKSKGISRSTFHAYAHADKSKRREIGSRPGRKKSGMSRREARKLKREDEKMQRREEERRSNVAKIAKFRRLYQEEDDEDWEHNGGYRWARQGNGRPRRQLRDPDDLLHRIPNMEQHIRTGNQKLADVLDTLDAKPSFRRIEWGLKTRCDNILSKGPFEAHYVFPQPAEDVAARRERRRKLRVEIERFGN